MQIVPKISGNKTKMARYKKENFSINMNDFNRNFVIRTLTLDFEYLEYHDYLKLNH